MDASFKTMKKELLPLLRSSKLTIVGVGNTMQGDDGIGVHIADEIKNKAKTTAVVVAGSTPENIIGPVIRTKPELILIIDAADFGGEIGTIGVFDPSTVEEEAHMGSTHALPMSMFSKAIKQELSEINILIIGIQAGRTFLGERISKPVRQAAKWLVSFLLEAEKYAKVD